MRNHTILIATLALGTALSVPSAANASAQFDSVVSGAFVGRDAMHPGVVQVADAGAQKFISSMAQSAISFLGNDGYSQTQKEAEFRKLLKKSFDMRTIGRFALGRYWNTASAQQQQEYMKLFESMVVNVYANRFNEYKGQKLEVAGARADGDKDTIVTSYIVAPGGGDKFKVDWRVRKRDGGYKVVDVIIEGVSMSLTQRSDFASVIQRGGGDMQALLTHLRAQQ